jgi:hypothetical protein
MLESMQETNRYNFKVFSIPTASFAPMLLRKATFSKRFINAASVKQNFPHYTHFTSNPSYCVQCLQLQQFFI